MLEDAITTPTRGEPNISLEEVDAEEVVVRIQATPLSDADGPKLADDSGHVSQADIDAILESA